MTKPIQLMPELLHIRAVIAEQWREAGGEVMTPEYHEKFPTHAQHLAYAQGYADALEKGGYQVAYLEREVERLKEALTIIEQGPESDRVSMTQEALIARAALSKGVARITELEAGRDQMMIRHAEAAKKWRARIAELEAKLEKIASSNWVADTPSVEDFARAALSQEKK